MVIVLTSCAAQPPAAPSAPPAAPVVRGVAVVEPTVSPRPYGAADTAFGLNMLTALCRSAPRQNLVFSPSALASALGMAYLGARGDTARAMASVLRLPAAGGQALAAGLQARTAALRDLAGRGVALAQANGIWADPSLTTNSGYLNSLATAYSAGMHSSPLLSDATTAARQIDAAVAATTKGHITKLVTPDQLQGIGWVLTAALYMNAAWASPFDGSLTKPAPFTTAAGQQVTASYLNGASYHAVTANGWTAVTLPYRGGKLTMTALLPPAGAASCTSPSATALAGMQAQLSAPVQARLSAPGQAKLSAPRGFSATIALPKVSIGTKNDITKLIARLGMSIAFGDRADFTGLSPQACCIGFVEQAATLKVGEKGTEASAAAAVGMVPVSGVAVSRQPVVFNRPYLMLVSAVRTGEPLFLARIANPAQS